MYITAPMPWAMSEQLRDERFIDLGNNWKAVRRWETQTDADGKQKLVPTQDIEYIQPRIYTHKQSYYPAEAGFTITERQVKQRLGVDVPLETDLIPEFHGAASSTLRL